MSGHTFDHQLDGGRLRTHREALLGIISDHAWRTLPELAAEVAERLECLCSETGISARLRELRRPKHGRLAIDKRRHAPGSGTWEYRLRPPDPTRPGRLFGDEDGRQGTLAALR